MPFTIKKTVDDRWFVAGEDADGTFGQTILASESWNMLQEFRQHLDDVDATNAAAEEFFAPLKAKLDAIKRPDRKDWSRVVLSESVEGQPEEGIILDAHGTILRILDETDGSSLRWVGNELIALD